MTHGSYWFWPLLRHWQPSCDCPVLIGVIIRMLKVRVGSMLKWLFLKTKMRGGALEIVLFVGLHLFFKAYPLLDWWIVSYGNGYAIMLFIQKSLWLPIFSIGYFLWVISALTYVMTNFLVPCNRFHKSNLSGWCSCFCSFLVLKRCKFS